MERAPVVMRGRRLPAVAAVVALLMIAGAMPAGSEAAARREITLTTSRSRVTHGGGFVLTGRVTAAKPRADGCVSGVEVSILREEYNDIIGNWVEVVRVTTDRRGRFRAALMAENSANYRAAVADVPTGCGAARSDRVAVRSRLRLTLRPMVTSVAPGGTAELVVTVRPRCLELEHDTKVVLQQLIDGEFVRVAAKAPDTGCSAVFTRRTDEDTVFRARHPEAASVAFFYLGNRSAPAVVSVRR